MQELTISDRGIFLSEVSYYETVMATCQIRHILAVSSLTDLPFSHSANGIYDRWMPATLTPSNCWPMTDELNPSVTLHWLWQLYFASDLSNVHYLLIG